MSPLLAPLAAALALAAAALPGPPARAEGCRFPSPPHVVRDEAGALLQHWRLEDRPALHGSTLPDSPALRDFRERIARALDTDPHALLRRQLPHVSGGDAENVRRVLAGEAGSIRPMSCLEGLLLATQAERSLAQGRSMYAHPTEFLAYVLARGDSLKVWYYTVDQPGIGGLAALHAPLEADREAGWEVVANVHNHNFFPEAEGVLGGVVPSATDVAYLRSAAESLGLSRASITNGFHSLDLRAGELGRLAGR